MPTARTLLSNLGVPLPTGAETKPPEQSSNLPAVPSAIENLPALPSSEDLGKNAATYAFFASTQSPKWQQQQAAGADDGCPMLGRKGQFTPLRPMRFLLLTAKAFRTHHDSAMNILAATRDMKARQMPSATGHPLRVDEHIVAVCLILHNGECIPAKVEFRGTKSNPAISAIRGVEDAVKPEFTRVSEAAKAASAFPHPWGRVVTEVTLVPRTSGVNGKGYKLAQGTTKPTPIADLQTVMAAFKSNEFHEELSAVVGDWSDKCNRIEALCK